MAQPADLSGWAKAQVWYFRLVTTWSLKRDTA